MDDPISPSITPHRSKLAIVSLISGILGWLSLLLVPPFGISFIPISPILEIALGFIAIWTGHWAKRKIRAGGGDLTGNGLASGGLILGYLLTVISVVLFCYYIYRLFNGAAQ